MTIAARNRPSPSPAAGSRRRAARPGEARVAEQRDRADREQHRMPADGGCARRDLGLLGPPTPAAARTAPRPATSSRASSRRRTCRSSSGSCRSRRRPPSSRGRRRAAATSGQAPAVDADRDDHEARAAGRRAAGRRASRRRSSRCPTSPRVPPGRSARRRPRRSSARRSGRRSSRASSSRACGSGRMIPQNRRGVAREVDRVDEARVGRRLELVEPQRPQQVPDGPQQHPGADRAPTASGGSG